MTITQQVTIIQLILHSNPNYPNVVVKPKHKPFLPMKK